MTPQEFERAFKPAPIYVFFSAEELFKLEGIRRIRKALLPDAENQLGFQEFDPGEVDMATVLDELRTLSLFGGERVVVLPRADSFFGLSGKKSSSEDKEEDEESGGKGKANRELLQKYLEKPNPGAHLIITTEKKWGSYKKLYAVMNKNGFLIDCTPPYENKIPAWVQRRAGLYQKSIQGAAARILAEEGGDSLLQLDLQLQKLVTYVGARPQITEEDVLSLIGHCSQENVFKLTDAAARRQTGQALEIVQNLLHYGVFEGQILSMLDWQFNRLLKAKKLQQAGRSGQEIGKVCKVGGYFLRGFLEQVRQFSEEGLIRSHELLLETDLATKSGAKSQLAIEKLIVQLCR